jgi:Protein of unknown function (DUF4038)/Putative collagen-binding domain of a collagenase
VIGMTFHTGMDRNTLEEWEFLWRYVVARYSAYAVSWLICGEYNQKSGDAAGRVDKVLSLGGFIKGIDPYHRAMTVHPWYYAGEKRQAWDQPWYDFIMLQGGHLGHGKVPPTSVYLEAYGRSAVKPVLEGECNYEGIYTGKDNREIKPEDVRRSAYHAIQAGSFGYTYGAQGLWYPTQSPEDKTFLDWGQSLPWWQSMMRPGAEQMGILHHIYEPVEWWKLEPRPSALESPETLTDEQRPIAKADGDKTYMIYFPEGSPARPEATLRIIGRQQTRYAGRWWNPRTGEAVAIPPVTTQRDGAAALPAKPDGQDWVLSLESLAPEAK